MILDLWGISFHAVVVFGLGKNLLFKTILGRCATFIDLSRSHQIASSRLISMHSLIGNEHYFLDTRNYFNHVFKNIGL